MPTALITGVAGQDGTLLSQMLLADGIEVVGLVKPGHDATEYRRYAPGASLVECDLGDADAVRRVVLETDPDEIYNLGGISSIMESVNNPELTERINVGAVDAILSAMRELHLRGRAPRLVQAASGTIFEGTETSPQDEFTERAPKTPYAVAKAESMRRIDIERSQRGLFACAAILYNHESPLRGRQFVTRRITEGAARIAAGLQDVLELGNLDVSRDWGWAPEYVSGMRLMAQADRPHDYVLATGESHELLEFIELAFKAAGIEAWRDVIRSSDNLRRHTDPTLMRGDSHRAASELGWRRTHTFAQIAQEMVTYDQLLLAHPDAVWHEQ